VPAKQIVTQVSKYEVTDCSDEADYFIRGYLSGSEPPPTTDADGVLVEGQAQVGTWLRSVDLWRQTGEWRPDGA
jgi:hypothetical protein